MKTHTFLYFAMTLSFFMLLLQGFQTELLYVRKLILAGEVWRLLSSQFVHLDYEHLAINTIGFWLLLAICHDVFPLKFLISSIFINALFVSLGLLSFHPEIQWYAGFSGILYGLYLTGGVLLMLSGHLLSGSILILVLLGKVLVDWLFSETSANLQTITGKVIDEAHRYGMLAAFLSCIPKISQSLHQHLQNKHL